MDELAKEIGVDPLEFRRKLMANYPKHLAVLNAVAEKGRVGQAGRRRASYRGLAQHMGFGIAMSPPVPRVSVDGNKVKVHRIVGATDPGYAVNPAQIDRQIAGSFIYGLTALFLGECTVKGRRDRADQPRHLRDAFISPKMPKVESIVMPSGGPVWGGVGEPTICVAAPAVLNAITAATGKRLSHLPAQEPRARDGCDGYLNTSGGRKAAAQFPEPFSGTPISGIMDMKFVLVVGVTFASFAMLGATALAADAPPGATSCSGCPCADCDGYVDAAAPRRPRSRAGGRGVAGVSQRPAQGHDHGPHRERLHARGNPGHQRPGTGHRNRRRRA